MRPRVARNRRNVKKITRSNTKQSRNVLEIKKGGDMFFWNQTLLAAKSFHSHIKMYKFLIAI